MDAPQLTVNPVTNQTEASPTSPTNPSHPEQTLYMVHDLLRSFIDDTDQAFSNEEETQGPNIHSAFIFAENEDYYSREIGVDVFEREARRKADWPVILRLVDKFRRDRTFADESVLDEVWRGYLRDNNILTREEQQAKDEYSLAKARTAKAELREAGLSDAARFGTCKRTGCLNRKIVSLLIRGFCSDCRGVEVKQTVAPGGRIDPTGLFGLDATDSEMVTSITVSANPEKIHPDVLELTTEERRERVLAEKRNNPAASVRDIAALTGIARSTVSDILKNPLVKSNPENSNEVKQFLRECAEKQQTLRESSRLYLHDRNKKKANPVSKTSEENLREIPPL